MNYIDVESLPLLDIVKQYAIVNGKIYFSSSDFFLLKHYCGNNNLKIQNISYLTFENNRPSQVHTIPPDKIDHNIHKIIFELPEDALYECHIVEEKDNKVKEVELNSLPLNDIVSKYIICGNMFIFSAKDTYLLLDYCFKNEIFFRGLDKFYIKDNCIYASGHNFDGSYAFPLNNLEEHFSHVHNYIVEAVNYIENDDVIYAGPYFEVMLWKK